MLRYAWALSGLVRHGRHVMLRRYALRYVEARTGRLGLLRRCAVASGREGRSEDCYGRLGQVLYGAVRFVGVRLVEAWQAWRVGFRSVPARSVLVRQAWLVGAWFGKLRSGMARQAWNVADRQGGAVFVGVRHGRVRQAWLGPVRLGQYRHGMFRQAWHVALSCV